MCVCLVCVCGGGALLSVCVFVCVCVCVFEPLVCQCDSACTHVMCVKETDTER